ncbi:MAG: hypothetical protein EHM24_32835 [Acidobacteria bacterium]|nr:MAG: hypothetical protein EHM24_32835 [Acidobacteriota bacterium]
MTRALSLAALVLLLGGAVACSDDCPDPQNVCETRRPLPPVGPSPLDPPTPLVHVIEFRVLGTLGQKVDIRYSTSQEGTTILSTQVPWSITHRTSATSSFLTLAAAIDLDEDNFDPDPVRVQVQIIVDGQLFREADAIGLEPTVTVSGLFSGG